MPIYLTTIEGSPEKTLLVDAPNKASAINHVARNIVSAEVQSPRQIVVNMQLGMKVEVVKKGQAELATAASVAVLPEYDIALTANTVGSGDCTFKNILNEHPFGWIDLK